MVTQPTVGQVVRVTAKHSDHNYQIGQRYIVCKVDSGDETLQAAGPRDGTAQGWIRWAEVEPVELGWDFAKSVLPAEVTTVLSANTGIEAIALRPQVKDAILKSLPDLRERIHQVMSACAS